MYIIVKRLGYELPIVDDVSSCSCLEKRSNSMFRSILCLFRRSLTDRIVNLIEILSQWPKSHPQYRGGPTLLLQLDTEHNRLDSNYNCFIHHLCNFFVEMEVFLGNSF